MTEEVNPPVEMQDVAEAKQAADGALVDGPAEEQKTLEVEEVEDDDGEPVRDQWSSRWSFILAAIGSAVGLGNFWRFPYLVYKHGGGPFLIPYWISLFVIGIPMLLLELGLGQKHQAGDVASFGKIHPKLRGVGYASVFVSWLVITYYTVIIAWTGIYFVESFYLPWVGDDVRCADGTVTDRTAYHFYHEVLKMWDEDCRDVGQGVGDSSEMSGRVVGSLVFTWVLVYVSVLYGVQTASYVVWITMPMPFLLSIVLFFRAITLDGAGDGIDAYIGQWDFDKLKEPQIWTDAVGQIFFSLGVCFGVMTSYGSYRPRNAPIIANVFIVSLTNCLFSFFCGFIVFGVLGFMAHEQTDNCIELSCGGLDGPALEACEAGCKVSVDDVAVSGFGLVFIAFPKAMDTMGDVGYFFSVITFLTLFTLGWDSAFALLEAITTVIMDAPIRGRSLKAILHDSVGPKLALPLVSACVAVSGLCMGLLFTADIGVYWLDLIDHYSNNYTMLFDGVLQVVAVGWVWGIPSMTRKVGWTSAMCFAVSSLVGASVFVLLTTLLAIDMAPCETDIVDGESVETCYTGWELLIGFASGMLVTAAGWFASFKMSEKPVREWFDAVWWAGAEELWSFVSKVDHHEGVTLGEGSHWIHTLGKLFGYWWMFMIKYVAPVGLSFLIAVTLKKDVRDPYENYQRWMNNTMWICCVALSIVIFIVFGMLPGTFGEPMEDPDPAVLYKDELAAANRGEENANGADPEGASGTSVEANEPIAA